MRLSGLSGPDFLVILFRSNRKNFCKPLISECATSDQLVSCRHVSESSGT